MDCQKLIYLQIDRLRNLEMILYYENNKQAGVQVTYDLNGERLYDYFDNMYQFRVWASHEFDCQTVEITDSNYRQLVSQGVI